MSGGNNSELSEDEGTLIWYIETAPGKVVEFNAPFKKQDFSNKKCISPKELEALKYTVLSRFHHLLRCISGYYEMLTSIGDQLGISLFGLASDDPLQFIKFEYDNFSGFERLSVPYICYTKPLPNTMAKVSAKYIKLEEFFNGPIGLRGSSRDIQRLLTGLCKCENVIPRQKFMQAREIQNCGMPANRATKFISWVGCVGENQYREYRIDANLTYAPAFCANLLGHEVLQVCALIVEKRMKEVPHYEEDYEWMTKDFTITKANLISAMAASPYMLLLQFEQINFASDYEWTKPKPLDKFSIDNEIFTVVNCKLEELSKIHFPAEETEPVESHATMIRKCAASLQENIFSILTYTNMIIRYCSSSKTPNRLIIAPLQKAIDGLFYAISITQYCEHVHKKFETIPIHLLTLIWHCLDPEKMFTNDERCFISMFNYDTLWENSEVKLAIAVNFFEYAKRKSTDQELPKEYRVLYRQICRCIPKLGAAMWEHTEHIYEEISDEQLVENSRYNN